MKCPIIDFHTHAFPENVEAKAVKFLEDHYKVRIVNKGTIGELIKSADEAGVQKIVLHSSATYPGQVKSINNWVADMADEKIIGFGTLHPDLPDFRQELDRIERLGLKGLKFHPDFQGFDIDEPRMWPLYEAIGDRLPILMHTGDEKLDHSSPKKLARILEMFPKLRIVAAHMGGYSRWEEAKEYLLGKEVYFDTSSCWWKLNPKEMTDLIRSHGTDRVVFGTDYPIDSHREELAWFMKLDLTPEEQENILWNNACRFLRLSA